jgi:acyl-coenzyme A thioesterase PaaI-like protein
MSDTGASGSRRATTTAVEKGTAASRARTRTGTPEPVDGPTPRPSPTGAGTAMVTRNAPEPDGATVTPVLLSYEDFRVRPHNCFACGELNEVGLHLQLMLEPGRCWTELEMPRRFEGWEGIIHGGVLCTVMDEVMAWALVQEDNWGVTARMSVDFRRPVTVGQRIRAEGWVTDTRRRIHSTAGRMVDAESGVELVRAEATYLAASGERKRELKERYGVAGGSRS